MKEKIKTLFVVEEGSIIFEIPGGVQVCTAELIDYFKMTTFDLEMFPVKTTRRISDRIKIKFGVDVYNSFDFKAIAKEICTTIEKLDIKLIALNQIVFAPLIPLIKSICSKKLFFIVLSHGNESGDFLVGSQRKSLVTTWKLGKLIANERRYYTEYVDGVVVISEHEVGVNQWLGATNTFVLPRMLKNLAVQWCPVQKRIGFVGTLNHAPNLIGLKLIVKGLKALDFTGEVRLVGGPKETGESLAKEFPAVTYVGRLTEAELIEEVASWSIFLNPVFWYSRGSSTKLAQGINWGIPVLTTPAGKRGYQLSDESIVVNSHDPLVFAKAIIKNCYEPQLINNLHTAVKNNINQFDKVAVAKELETFLRTVVQCKT